jgi:hypothetical protein
MSYEKLSSKSNNALGVLMTMILATATGYILLHPEQVNHGKGLDSTFKLVVKLMLTVSVFLMMVFARWMLFPPVIFSYNDKGFTYKPNGVSFGFVEWCDVLEIREISIMIKKPYVGTIQEKVLSVIFKNPQEYINKAHFLIRPIISLRFKMSGSPLILNFRDLGKNHSEVLAEIEKYVPFIVEDANAKCD